MQSLEWEYPGTYGNLMFRCVGGDRNPPPFPFLSLIYPLSLEYGLEREYPGTPGNLIFGDILESSLSLSVSGVGWRSVWRAWRGSTRS